MESLLIWSAVLLLVVVSVGLYVRGFVQKRRSDSSRLVQTRELGMDKAMGQYPQIDAAACIGCGTCVDACPEGDVLGIVLGKAVVINGARCIGHGKCAEVCPLSAIKVGLGDISQRDDIPLLDEWGQTNVPGLWIAGELSGFALISNAVEQGRRVMNRIAATRGPRSPDILDVVVIGAGPAGMSAGLIAQGHGLKCVILDQQGAGGTILQYPRHKLVMVQPVELPGLGQLPGTEYSKEKLLEIWEGLHQKAGLDIRTGVRVTGVTGSLGNFTVIGGEQSWRCGHVVLALGRRGTPRRLNVPGEDLPKVVYKLIDAEAYAGRRVIIVGGGDSAVEAAIGLSRQQATQVTLSYRKPELLRIKQRNAERVAPLIASGAVDFCGGTVIKSIAAEAIVLEGPDGPAIVPNDDVIILAGGIPPFGLLRELGIRFGGDQPDIRPLASSTTKEDSIASGTDS